MCVLMSFLMSPWYRTRRNASWRVSKEEIFGMARGEVGDPGLEHVLFGKVRVYIGKKLYINIYIYYTKHFRICCGFNEFVYMCWIVDMFFPL